MLVPQGTQNHRPVAVGEAGYTVADSGDGTNVGLSGKSTDIVES